MKAFNEQGMFWLPDNPSDELSGVLNYDPVSGITLDLMGEFDLPPGRSSRIDRVLGRIKARENKGVLLENCRLSDIGSSAGMDFSYSYISYDVSVIYRDVLFNEDKKLSGKLRFDKIIVEIPLLLQWVGVYGLECRYMRDYRGDWIDPDILVSFKKPNKIKASTETRDEVGFDFTRTLMMRRTPLPLPLEIKLTQITRFFYTSRNASCDWDDLLRQSTAIARLLSLAFAQKVSPSSIKLRQAGEWEYERLIEIFFCPDEYAEEIEEPEEIIDGNYYGIDPYKEMGYAALGGMSFVKKWLELADKNYAVLSKLMSCKFGSMPYLEDKFHQARSAIEAYWVISERGGQGKQFRPAKKLLVDLVKEAGFSDVLGEDPSSWASSVEANRNGYSSHFQQITQPVDMKKMEQQTDCLYYLTLVLLLKEAGVEYSVLDRFRHIVKRLHKTPTTSNPQPYTEQPPTDKALEGA